MPVGLFVHAAELGRLALILYIAHDTTLAPSAKSMIEISVRTQTVRSPPGTGNPQADAMIQQGFILRLVSPLLTLD